MAASGATVLNCPRVFARSGVTAAFSRFAGHGVRTVVGTDGYNMDLLGELNAASMISKITSARADVANAPELIESVTATAAAVIKRPDLGMITPGATADLTVVDLTHPHLQPLFDPRRGLIALGNRANIDQVIVDGRMLIDAANMFTATRLRSCRPERRRSARSGICRKLRRPSMADGPSMHPLSSIGEASSFTVLQCP